jgi:hypothetical protein
MASFYNYLIWIYVVFFQAVYRWLNQKDSGVSGNNNAGQRKAIIQLLRQLKYAGTVGIFMMIPFVFFNTLVIHASKIVL